MAPHRGEEGGGGVTLQEVVASREQEGGGGGGVVLRRIQIFTTKIIIYEKRRKAVAQIYVLEQNRNKFVIRFELLVLLGSHREPQGAVSVRLVRRSLFPPWKAHRSNYPNAPRTSSCSAPVDGYVDISCSTLGSFHSASARVARSPSVMYEHL